MFFAFVGNVKLNTDSYFKGQEKASLCISNPLRVRSKVLIYKALLDLHLLPRQSPIPLLSPLLTGLRAPN